MIRDSLTDSKLVSAPWGVGADTLSGIHEIAGLTGIGAIAQDFAQARGFIDPPGYRRHRPQMTLLYWLVARASGV